MESKLIYGDQKKLINGDKKRNEVIDIIKAIAIISIVLGHADGGRDGIGIYFDMSAFFIASGYTFNTEYSDNITELVKFFKKRIYRLYIPYVVINMIYMFMNNLFVKIGFYSEKVSERAAIERMIGDASAHLYYNKKTYFTEAIKILLFQGGTEFGGAKWFLRVLFFTAIFYGVSDYLIKRISCKYCYYIETIIGIFFSIIGYYIKNKSSMFSGIYGQMLKQGGVLLMAYILFLLGILYHKYETKISVPQYLFIIGITILLILYSPKIINRQYGILISICMWFDLIFVARIIKRIGPLGNIMSYIGKNTLYILVFHLICFKLVNIMLVKCEGLSWFYVAAFPTLDSSKWVLYTLIGVILSLIIGEICKFIWDKVKKLMLSYQSIIVKNI